MTLVPGKRLGPYEVLAPLGAGGMGEVWRARDTRLAREVALKVLPDHLSDDPKALARFENEAKAVAALSHPHILAIHDVGRADGVSYVVTELLEGETLRAPLLRGPLPLRKALDVAAQLADALAAAHEKGIVHRDVKPENVILTKDGRAKLLDFGLARHDAGWRADADTRSPTVSVGTEPGAVLGTVAYMSPEQSQGLPVGIGSDQFSLGIVLYEMLAGKRPFRGPSSVETLAAIVRAEPEPLDSTVPAPLRWILDRLLAKDPAERYASTRDLARDLANCRQHLTETTIGSTPGFANRRRSSVLIASLVSLAAVMALYAVVVHDRGDRSRDMPTFRKLTFRSGHVSGARFTPDGFSFAYSASWGGRALDQLFSARLDAPAAPGVLEPGEGRVVAVRGGEIAVLVPDPSRSPGPNSDRAFDSALLAIVPLGGGPPRPVVDGVLAADWGPGEREFAVVRAVEGRERLEYPPGRVLFETAGWIRFLSVSSNGDRVAMAHHPKRGSISGELVVVERGGKAGVLSKGWSAIQGVRWSPDGSEIWFTAGRVWGSANLHAARPDGTLRTLYAGSHPVHLLDVLSDGRVLAAAGARTVEVWGRGHADASERSWSWLDGTGVTGLSRDGTLLLLTEFGEGGGPSCSTFLRRTDGNPPVRLGSGRGRGLSPDGSLALVDGDIADPSLRLVPTGPGEARTLVRGSIDTYHWAAFFPDGRRILLVANEAGRPMRLFVQDVAGGPPRPLSPEGIRVAEPSAAVSPDGTRVAAVQVTMGAGPVLVRVADGTTEPIEGLEAGDVPLSWTADGKALFVRVPSPARLARIVRYDLSSRRKHPWRELQPPDPAGALLLYQPVISSDGATWFYTVTRALSNLYLVEGLR